MSPPEVVQLPKPKRGVGRPPKQENQLIEIPELKLGFLTLTLKGTTSLIVHNFSAKSRRAMLDKQTGVPQQKRDKKIPTNDFLGALYVMGKAPKLKESKGETYAVGQFGFPAGGVKKCAVSGCRSISGIAMTEARAAFHVVGTQPENLVEILSAAPRMREDVVRLSGPRPVADIRFRPEFEDWSMKLTIRYDTKILSPSQIANLFNQAGFSVGLGEWRPERGGDHGMFEVASTQEVIVGRGKR